jgi:flagellar basal-body rod modification protein FlgD
LKVFKDSKEEPAESRKEIMQISTNSNPTSPFQAPSKASSAVTADDTTSNSPPSSSSATSTATITANDFLQLLVTELQNQDPTANTDPNEYVDQLVQVNSLQQQIQMNQTLDGGPTLTGATSGVLQELTQMNQTLTGDVASTGSSSSASLHAAPSSTHATALASGSAGNLSTASNPTMQASAETVANALAASPNHTGSGGENLAGQIPTSQIGAFQQFAARLRASAPTP